MMAMNVMNHISGIAIANTININNNNVKAFFTGSKPAFLTASSSTFNGVRLENHPQQFQTNKLSYRSRGRVEVTASSASVAPKKILIMGGTRFIGLYLTRLLVKAGHEVTLFTRGKSPVTQKLAGESDQEYAEFSSKVLHIKGDRQDFEFVKTKLSASGFDVVYDINGREAVEVEPILDALPNIEQYIYCSSAGVYLKSDILPHFETDAVDPKSRHKGKLDTENLLTRRGTNWTSLRPVYIYGPLNYNPVEEWFFHRLKAGRPIPIPNSGLQMTQLGHVKDLARAFLMVLGNEKANKQVYNISGAKYVTFSGLAKACAKTYMFKLMKSSGVTESGESEKILLLVESGVRLHTTVFVRDKSTTPSGFTLKLRKHIRTRRLEDVRQLGMDRVVDFQFGLGENAHHIILELYAQGNLLLTDSNYTVLTLLRTHRDDERGMTMMPHHCYPVNMCRFFKRTSFEKLQTIFSNATKSEAESFFQDMGAEAGLDPQATSSTEKDAKRDKTKHWKTSSEQSGSEKRVNDGSKSGKKATLKAILGESLGYGPALCEHIILDAGLQPNMKVEAHTDILQALAASFANFEGWLQEVITGESVPEGYIIMHKDIPGKKEGFPDEERQSGQVYDEFSPLLLHQFKSRNFMNLGTFDESMDEFFSKIESQRAEQQQKAQEQSATQKLNKIRLDQENRVQSLKKEVDYSIRMAELIEYNLEDVDAAILAVRAALASGMDWKGLVRMVKEEKKAGNPVAGLIHSLQLEKNCITLLLSNNLDDMDEDEKTQPVDKVEVDLALSGYANARRWFGTKKKQASKQEKTIAAHAKAFKAAEKKTQQQLSQAKTVAAISHIRKVHWFEKFDWFISSENYLVISGRDAQQNELIVKRYMNKGDLYVHAELHGASSTVIKNHNPDHQIPPLTLNQAGCFTVCHSQAWDSKIVTSAWWVHPHQVSKTAPTGEYLTVGSFMIRGRKNFLPPHPLVMGFGILFRMDESSLGSHINERRVRSENENQENDREEKETHEARLALGSDGHDNERSSEQDSSTDDEVIGDSKLTDHREENYAESGDHNKISVFSTSMKENGIRGALAKGQQDTDFSLADYKEAPGKNRVEDIPDQTLAEMEELMDKALGLGSVKLSGKDQSSKYGLEVYQTTAEARNIVEPSKLSHREKPYLSKAERRKLKRGTKHGAESNINQETNEKCLETDNLGNRAQQAETVATDEKQDMTAPSGKVGRGRRGKLKKIKEKYAEQDEEERQLRMALLASAGKGSKDIESKREKEVVATVKGIIQAAGEADITKICYKCKKPGHVARDCPESIEERNELIVDLSQLTTVDSEANLGRTTLTENERLAFQEDDIHELGDDEKEKLTELDTLTGIPVPNDILLYAVPVCGPYNALQGYKFHVKITPGTAKKGKAAKTAINLFTHMQDATTREKELMKALNEPELVAAMIGNAKIVAPGLTQLKQRQKKGKKSSPHI